MGAIELFRGKVEKVDSMEAVFSIDKSGIIGNFSFFSSFFLIIFFH